MTFHKHLLTAIVVLFTSRLLAQDFVWAIQQSGNDNEAVNQVAEDAAGYIYETGNFWGTVDFKYGPGTYNLTSNGLTDNFICKLSPAGDFIWARKTGGTGYDNSVRLCVDANNNLHTGGKFQATVDFDPSGATYNLISAGIDDAFIASYSTDGELLWAAKFGSTGYDYLEGLVTMNGYLYATGYFQGTVDFDPGPDTYNLTATGPDAAFFLKLDTDGNFIWAKSISGTSSIISFDIDVDSSGNVYAGGEWWSTCDFDPGTGTQTKTATNFSADAFLLKLDEDGNFAWVNIFKGTGDEWLKSIDLHDNGDIGIAGVFQVTLDADPGAGIYNLVSNGVYDFFVCRINGADGTLIWAKSAGGATNDQLGQLDVAASGDYFLSGGFSSTVDFDPGPGNYSLTAVGSLDILFWQLDGNGLFKAAFGFGSAWASCFGNGILANNSGGITLAGGFANTIDFDPGPDTYNLTSALTTTDCFVVHFNTCITLQTYFNTTICSGDSVFAGGIFQTTSGVYYDSLFTNIGCDSVVITNLVVLPPITAAVNAAICEGSAYLFNGLEIFDAGIYTDTLSSATGCDSTVTLMLDVLQSYYQELTETICEGSTIVFNGNEIDSAGEYTAIYLNSAGCDSTVILHLSVTTVGGTVMQSNDTLYAIGEGTVYWILCESGLPIPSADQPIFVPEVSGVYAAVFTNGNCTDTTDCSFYTGTVKPKDRVEVFLFPNPASNEVTVEAKNTLFPAIIELRSPGGILIERKEFVYSVTLQTEHIPAGIYFLTIVSEEYSLLKKLIIAH